MSVIGKRNNEPALMKREPRAVLMTYGSISVPAAALFSVAKMV